MVTTKVPFCWFFKRPRTAVMPVGFSPAGHRMGFIAVYRTEDPAILAELHEFFVGAMASGHFEVMLTNAKEGVFFLPTHLEHLRPYFVGFNA